jgi:hypothetical protein
MLTFDVFLVLLVADEGPVRRFVGHHEGAAGRSSA